MSRLPKSLLFVCLCLMSVESALSAQQEPKLAHLVVVDNELAYANGVWRTDDPTRRNAIAESVTDFSCHHHGGDRLLATDAFCIRATATITDSSTGLMNVKTDLLQVTQWSDTQIIATEDAGCVTRQFIFDLKRNIVSAIDMKKADAEADEAFCGSTPEKQSYYFQDLLDYYGHK